MQDLNQKTNVLDAEKLSKIRIEEIQIDPNDENFEFNIEHQVCKDFVYSLLVELHREWNWFSSVSK